MNGGSIVKLRSPPASTSAQPAGVYSRTLLWLQLVVSLVLLSAVIFVAGVSRDPSRAEGAVLTRQVASKLLSAGVIDEAASLYQDYLWSGEVSPDSHASIAFSLGNVYLDAGRYQEALRWYYEAETVGTSSTSGGLVTGGQGGSITGEAARKIVHCLEKLGKLHQAQAVLASSTTLEASKLQHADADPLVARIGSREIRLSELLRALDELPPGLAEPYSGSAGKKAFLEKYVADELIWRKARKLEYDSDPEVLEQIQAATRQIVLGAFVEKEILGKVVPTDTDLETWYSAHKVRYREPDRARVRVLELADMARARELAPTVSQKAAFALAARENSLHEASRGKGGLLEGWVEEGQDFLGEGDARTISDLLFSAREGQVVGPFQAGDHVYLLRLEKLEQGGSRDLDEVREQVERDYRMARVQEAYGDLIQQELSADDVQLFPQALEEQG